MLEEVKKSLEEAPVVKKGDYDYFVHSISDGIPAMKPQVLRELCEVIKKHAKLDVDKIVAIEAMGIHLGTALSLATDIPFLVIRKRQYGLEGEKEVFQKTGYGSSHLYINDLKEGEKILLIDDVVSTGGTLISVVSSLENMGINVSEVLAVIEKGDGRKIFEEATGKELLTIVKLDVVDGKVVIESTIED